MGTKFPDTDRIGETTGKPINGSDLHENHSLDEREQKNNAEDWFQSAGKKFDLGDFQGAVDDLTKSIDLDPLVAEVVL